jgi:hypothetical protein
MCVSSPLSSPRNRLLDRQITLRGYPERNSFDIKEL